MKIIRCFIAGAKDQESQRDILTSVLGKMQSKWNIMFESRSFLDFNGTLSSDGQQKDYNEYILFKADLVVFIFDHNVGDKTIEEFIIAYKGLLSNNHPDILVFCNSSLTENSNIKALNLMMNQLHQYYIEYKDDKDLKHIFSDEIDKYIKYRKERTLPEWIIKEFLNSNRYAAIKNQLLIIFSILLLCFIIYIGCTSGFSDSKQTKTEEMATVIHSIYDNIKIIDSKTIMTTNNIVCIEKLSSNTYRYLSWNISRGTQGKKEPSLIIEKGEYKNGYYRFKKGAYLYLVPKDEGNQLLIMENDKILGNEDIIDFNYTGIIEQANKK